MTIRSRAVLLMALASLPACRDEPKHAETEDGRTPASMSSQIDRLRSLGYVGFSPAAADPDQSGVFVFDEARSCPGYNLLTLHSECRSILLAPDGRVVRSWTHPGGRHWAQSELLPDGDLLVVGGDAAPDAVGAYIPDRTRFLMRLNWEGSLRWKRHMPVHHDVEQTPDGQLLTLTLETRPIPEIHPTYPTRADRLTLLSGEGDPLAHCSLYEAMQGMPGVFQFQRVAPMRWGPDVVVDLFHANSIEWMHHPDLAARHAIYAATNILFCTRHQDIIGIINWEERRLLWFWGQNEISGPHDAQVLDSGHILLFDNGLGRGWSRVIELEPLSKEIVWEYRAPSPTDFYTASRGSAQRLPNGNTLITNSDNGLVFEVTPDGTTVWEYRNPHLTEKGQRGTISRTKRYTPEYIQQIEASREDS